MRIDQLSFSPHGIIESISGVILVVVEKLIPQGT